MDSDGNEFIFKPIDISAIPPKRQSDGAAGYDIFSVQDDEIPPMSSKLLKLRFCIQMPDDVIGLIVGRSGLALKHGIEVINSYAINDRYIEICLNNTSRVPFSFEFGTRIAQLVFLKISNRKITQ